QGVPGVTAAAVGGNFALSSGDWVKSVWVEGQRPEQEQMAAFNVVSPSFFSTAGIPVLEGREFTDRDVLGAPKVVVINEAFAKRYFPGQNPVGRHFGDKGEKSILKYERSEEHTSELQSPDHLVCRLLLGQKDTSDWMR